MLLFGSVSALCATAVSGTRKVESLFFGEDGGVFVAFSPAPSMCAGGTRYRMHAKVLKSQGNHKELVSALLAAYMSGAELRYIWVSHFGGEEAPCSVNHYLQLHMMELSPK